MDRTSFISLVPSGTIDPTLLLEPLLEHVTDFLGDLLGPALHRIAAAFSPYTFIPVLSMSPAGLPVATKAASPTAEPGVLFPPEPTSPDPSLCKPFAVIWKPSTATFISDCPAENPIATRLAALPS